MPRRSARDTGRRPPPTPRRVTPRIVSRPPTPTIGEAEAMAQARRRRARQADSTAWLTPSPAFAGLQQAGYSPAMAGMGGTAKEFAIAGTSPATEWSAWTALLGRAGQGFLEAFGLQEPLSRLHTPMYGRGGVPYRATSQAATRMTPEQFQAKYGGQPTEPFFMREGLGGTAGRAGEIMQAWAGGGRPQFVPKTVVSLLGVNEDQMKEMGYERTLGGSWRATFPERPELEVPPDGYYNGGGYGYGYTPSRYPTGGGGYGYWPSDYGGGGTGLGAIRGAARGRAAAGRAGLVNWKI